MKYNIGDTVECKIEEDLLIGLIIAINDTSALVKTNNGIHQLPITIINKFNPNKIDFNIYNNQELLDRYDIILSILLTDTKDSKATNEALVQYKTEILSRMN